jgi:1,4-alpha-glucan branching enzyme
MRRGQGGVWTVELPLAPGRRYEYMFVVDGRWVTDPTAPASVDDGFGGQNAVLDL